MSDAILFSANPSIVDFDDAMSHLESHKELYWSVGFSIAKDQFTFPLFGFIHVSGRQVEYRALISDILPSSAAHYESASLAAQVKPQVWIDKWKNETTEERTRWKNALVMTEIVPFSFDTYKFEKYGGGFITHPPQGYARVSPPNQPATLESPLSQVSVAERDLEDSMVRQPGEIEAGLQLVKRQLATPAGRLDLLCTDAQGNYVVIELKKTKGTDQVVGQILRYMGWVQEEHPGSKVRGIIVVSNKHDVSLRYALRAAPNIEVKEFTFSIR